MNKIKNHFYQLMKKTMILILTITMIFAIVQINGIQSVNADGEALANISFSSRIVKKVGTTETTQSVASGEPFFLAINYNVNSAGDNVFYKDCLISIPLPEHIQFDELDLSQGASSIFNKAEVVTSLGRKVLQVTSHETLAPGNAGTLYLKMHFENMTTPDGKIAVFENMAMTGNESSGSSIKPLKAVSIPSSQITATAFQDWQVNKSIEQQDNQNNSVITKDGVKYYQVNYRILVRPGDESVSGNRYGRLNCSKFTLIDTLPNEYPVKKTDQGTIYGGASHIEINVGNKVLKEGEDYTLQKNNDGTYKSIEFKYLNTYKNSTTDTNYVPEGTPVSTTYTVKVLYPYDAYEIPFHEDFIEKNLNNLATLTYQPLLKEEKKVNSNANVQLGWQKNDVEKTDFTVTKRVKVLTTGSPSIEKEDTQIFDKHLQDVYYRDGKTIQFGLYTDKECTIFAKDYHNQSVNPMAIDENGQVHFKDIIEGTYYLKEISDYSLFKKTDVKKIVVSKEDGSLTVDEQPVKDQNIDFINETDNNGYGYVAFWKRGSSATQKDAGWLKGVPFTLTNETDPTQKYEAQSNENGLVLFEGIPAGEYLITEVNTDGEFEVNDQTWHVTVIGNQVNYPRDMDIFDNQYPYVLNKSNKGKLKFIKVDQSQPSKQLTGAKFELYIPKDENLLNHNWTQGELNNPDFTEFDTVSLDTKNQSSIETSALKPGNYIYREVVAPNGYTLDSTCHMVTVKQNTLVEVKVENIPQGSLEIQKYGILSQDIPVSIPLAGASFKIYTDESCDKVNAVKDKNGNPIEIKSILTASGGVTSNIVSLDAGTYYVKESEPPEGYVLNETVYPVNISAGQRYTLTLNNKVSKQGQLEIKKVDAKTNQSLKGASFTIYDEDHKFVETIKTGEDGTAQSGFLPSGDYILKETQAPQGYVMLDKEIAFVISDNQITSLDASILANVPYVKYQLEKVSSINHDIKLKNVVFRLYEENPTSNQNATYQTYTSNDQGIVTFPHLIPGKTYYYQEESTLDGYTRDQSVHEFSAPTIENTKDDLTQKDGPEIVENIPMGRFHIQKTVQKMDSTESEPLDGIHFSYYPKLSDNASADLEKAKIDKTYLSLGTTANGGELQSPLVNAGDYWVVEDANDNYKVIEPQVVHVEAGVNEKTDKNTSYIQNTYAKGVLKLKKVDAISKKAVVASFNLYKKVDNLTDYSKENPIKTFKTNTQGEWSSQIEPGDYVLIEQSVEGAYVLDQTIHPITIEAGKTNTTYYNKPIENVPTGSLSLVKYESWNNNQINIPIKGFNFKIYTAQIATQNEEGAILYQNQYYKKGTDTNQTITSDFNKVTVNGLKPGFYYIEEVLTDEQIQNGYKQAPSQVIELLAGKEGIVTFKNINEKSKIKLTKVDANDSNEKLDNAVFDIYRLAKVGEKGETITIGDETYQVVALGASYHITSGTVVIYDEDGNAYTAKGEGFSTILEPGVTYFLKEVQTPKGYLASQQWVKVGELQAGQLAEITVKNYRPIEVSGQKVDKDGNNVKGATFALLTSQTKANAVAMLSQEKLSQLVNDKNLQEQYGIIQVTTTGDDGKIKFTQLDSTQTYYIIELKAPENYERDTKVHKVTIKVEDDQYLFIDGDGEVLSVINYQHQQIWLKKVLTFAGETKPLNGVEFRIYKAIENQEGTFIYGDKRYGLGDKVDSIFTGTDTAAGDGGAVTKRLSADVYIVEEINSLKDMGLIVNEENRYHVVNLTLDSYNQDLWNKPIQNTTNYGQFYLNKISSLDDKRLQATFELQVKNGDKYVPYKTSSGNTITITTTGNKIYKPTFYLPAGDYQLVETSVEAGYTLSTSPIQFTIEAGKITGMNGTYDKTSDAQNDPLIVQNTPQGRVALTKVGKRLIDLTVKEEALANVQFDVYEKVVVDGQLVFSNENKVGTAISQDDGHLLFKDKNGKKIVNNQNWLDAGEYIIKETDISNHGANGYNADYIGEFIIESNELTQQIQRVNEKGKPIGQITSQIINESSYGQFQIKKVDFYSSKPLSGVQFEIYTKSGNTYQKVENSLMTTNDNGMATSKLLPEGEYYVKEVKTLDGYFIDEGYYGPYKVEKQTVTPSTTAITNQMKQTLKVIKKDSKTGKIIDESRMSGTTFALYSDQELKHLIGETTYGENGIVFENLRPNTTYYLKEVKAPIGYELLKNPIPITTSKTQDDTSKPVINEINVDNSPLGSLVIDKFAQWELPDSSTERLPLAGVEFTLYKEDGSRVDTKTTDKNGHVEFLGLAQGKYTFKETNQITGFAKNEKVYSVTITEGEINSQYTHDKAIINYPELGKFAFQKVKADKSALTNAYFKLVKIENNQEKVVFDNFTTEDDGTFSSAMLEPGNYRLYEIQAPDGFTKIQPIDFKIVAKQITQLGQDGKIIDHAQGNIIINKYDDMGDYTNHGNKPLAGIYFGLYKGNTLIEEMKTNENGQIVFKNVDPGDYTIQEIKRSDSPQGYQYSDTPQYSVTISEGKSEVINYYPKNTNDGVIINQSTMGRIVVHKIDDKTKEGLKGAIFGVYSDDQYTNEVTRFETNDNGLGISELLGATSSGTQYYLKEIKAPDGYVLDDDLHNTKQEVIVYPIQDSEVIIDEKSKNYFEFENKSQDNLLNFETGIQKGITTSMKKNEEAEKSLSQDPYTTTFAIRGFANGKNTVPANYIEVSDTKTKFQYYSQGEYHDLPSHQLTSDSYVITDVKIYRAYNQKEPSKSVNATVYYKGLNDSEWKAVPNGYFKDIQSYTGGTRSVALDESLKAMHIMVKYEGVDKNFESGGFDYEVKFNQRRSDKTLNEIRKIVNVADVKYNFKVKDNEGNMTSQVVEKESNQVEILFPALSKSLPTVNIGVVASDPNNKNTKTFKPGETVQFDITVKNVSDNDTEFEKPIISFDMPIGMSINNEYAQGKNARYLVVMTSPDGKMKTIDLDDLLITYSYVDHAREVIDGQLQETNNTTTKVTFRFKDDFTLPVGSSIRITLAGTISSMETKTTLWMPTYLNSEKKVIQSAENPYGNSFDVNVSQGNSNPLVDDEILDRITNEEIIGGNKYANAYTDITVNENNSLSIVKYVKGDYDDEYLNYNQVATTSPGGNIDYKIEVFNGEESDSPIHKIRIVDLLPFDGDSLVGRENEKGNVTRRVTDLKREAILKNVKVTKLPETAKYQIYYCIDSQDLDKKWDKWKVDAREKITAINELPMLYKTMDDSAWKVDENYHHWVLAKDITDDQLKYVSAVAVEIECQNEIYLEKGQKVEIDLSMKAPMYSTNEVEEYSNKLISNSAMVAVGRVGHSDSIANNDRIENQEVKVQLTMPKGSLGDYAFYDINRNGIQDEGDAPIKGLTVSLHEFKTGKGQSEPTETIYTTSTDNNGFYLFENLNCNVLKTSNQNSTNPEDFIGDVYYEYQVEFALPDDESRYRYEPTLRYAKNDKGIHDETIDSNIGNEKDKDDYLKTEKVRLTAKRGDDGKTFVGENNPTLDAGFYALGALGDYVWIDANNNGIQDADEKGLNGVIVNLYQVDGDQLKKIAQTQTETVYGKDGYYLFEGLTQGQYVVEFDISQTSTGGYAPHYAFTKPHQGNDQEFDSNAVEQISSTIMRTDIITLEQRGYDMTIDAGVTVYSALTGIAFEDRNYSDKQDLDGKTDVYIPGTRVELYRISDIDGSRSEQPIATQTVGNDGQYYFDHLEAGQYQVKFIFPKDYEIINANVVDDTLDNDVEYDLSENRQEGFTDIITIGENELVKHVDGGAARYSSLGDYVWYDANKNGIQDHNDSEYPISNVAVYLQMRSPETVGWEQVASTLTNEEGYYRFDHLKSSEYGTDIEYRILFDLPINTHLTIPYQGNADLDSNALSQYIPGLGFPTDSIYLKYYSEDLSWDAGIISGQGAVGDYVWFDTNQNGIQDENDTGISGIKVVLEYNESGDITDESLWKVLGTTYTNEHGYYIFTGLQEGMYRVRFQIDKPYYVTLSTMGNDNAIDSDGVTLFEKNWYYTRAFYLDEEGYDMTWDCGVYLPETSQDSQQNDYPFLFPITGDQSSIIGYGLLAGAALVTMSIMNKKRKNKNKSSQEQ